MYDTLMLFVSTLYDSFSYYLCKPSKNCLIIWIKINVLNKIQIPLTNKILTSGN